MAEDADTRKKERAAAGALVLVTRRAERSAAAAADAGLDAAVADAVRYDRRERLRKAALLGAVLVASHALSGRLRGAYEEGRAAGRTGARKRLSAELAGAGFAGGAGLLGQRGAAAADPVRAQGAADQVAANWRSAAFVAVSRAALAGEDAARAIDRTRERLVRQAELAARDETADAYLEERREVIQAAAKEDADFARRVVRVWVSALETRTCHRCESHHGDTTPAGESFDGNEPGDMHPHCLCTDYLSVE